MNVFKNLALLLVVISFSSLKAQDFRPIDSILQLQIQKHNTDLNFTLITKKRSSAKQILECEIPFIKTIYLEDKILKITNSKFLNFFILLKFIKKK